MNPNIRTVTSASTIPAGVNQSGTLTVDTNKTDCLQYDGTAEDLEAILGVDNSGQTKDWLWVYLPDDDKVFRVLAWWDVTIKIDGDATGISAANWQTVNGNLVGWSVLNQDSSAATVNGQSLGAGNSISFSCPDAPTNLRRYADVVLVDGAALLVEEKLG